MSSLSFAPYTPPPSLHESGRSLQKKNVAEGKAEEKEFIYFSRGASKEEVCAKIQNFQFKKVLVYEVLSLFCALSEINEARSASYSDKTLQDLSSAEQFFFSVLATYPEPKNNNVHRSEKNEGESKDSFFFPVLALCLEPNDNNVLHRGEKIEEESKDWRLPYFQKLWQFHNDIENKKALSQKSKSTELSDAVELLEIECFVELLKFFKEAQGQKKGLLEHLEQTKKSFLKHNKDYFSFLCFDVSHVLSPYEEFSFKFVKNLHAALMKMKKNDLWSYVNSTLIADFLFKLKELGKSFPHHEEFKRINFLGEGFQAMRERITSSDVKELIFLKKGNSEYGDLNCIDIVHTLDLLERLKEKDRAAILKGLTYHRPSKRFQEYMTMYPLSDLSE